jgi:hypothetical protein
VCNVLDTHGFRKSLARNMETQALGGVSVKPGGGGQAEKRRQSNARGDTGTQSNGVAGKVRRFRIGRVGKSLRFCFFRSLKGFGLGLGLGLGFGLGWRGWGQQTGSWMCGAAHGAFVPAAQHKCRTWGSMIFMDQTMWHIYYGTYELSMVVYGPRQYPCENHGSVRAP